MPVDYQVPPKSGAGFYGRLCGNLCSPLPYSVATHASRAMQRAMDRLQANDPPDLWHCEWTPYAQAMRRRPGRWVVMAHNVESVIWRRYRRGGIESPEALVPPAGNGRSSSASNAGHTPPRREPSRSAARTPTRIEQQFGTEPVDVVENGVDTGFFTPDETVIRDAFRILFLGSLDWRPNLDAVRLLLDEIFPRVQAAEPRAKAGHRRPQTTGRPQGGTGESPAGVETVWRTCRTCGRSCTAPGCSRCRSGSAADRDSRSWRRSRPGYRWSRPTVGVEGLRLTDGKHCTVADGPDAFAAALVAGDGRIRQPPATRPCADGPAYWANTTGMAWRTGWIRFGGPRPPLLFDKPPLAPC